MVDERDQNKTEVIQLKLEMEDFKEMWIQENTHHKENQEEIQIKDNYEVEEETQD